MHLIVTCIIITIMTSVSNILRRHRLNILVCAAFFVLAFAAYYSILNNTFIGDDFDLIERANRAHFPDFWPLFVINKVSMRPLTFFVLWIQSHIFGNQASMPSHILSVGIHAGCAFLLYWLLGKIRVSKAAAFLTALLFLLTPVAPESVTWSVVRFDVMVLFFMLLTLGLYASYLAKRHNGFYFGALAASTAAIFSKEMAITLLFIIPAMDFLLGRALIEDGSGVVKDDWKTDLRGAVIRLLPFFVPFTIYFSIRYIAIGKVFGSYKNLVIIGIPNIVATEHSLLTLLSPLNEAIFSNTGILYYGCLSLVMVVAATATVVFRWRATSTLTRRIWIFLVFFFIVSFAPIFSQVFIMGLNNSLRESRYLYIPTMGFIAIIVVGLLEFGWKKNFWRIPVIASLLVVAPISLFCLNQNNRVWERTALISYYLPRETQRLLPDPPQGAKLYFTGVPEWSGAYLYTNGLPTSVRWTYGRSDLTVSNPNIVEGKENLNDADVFLFAYDEENNQLNLIELR